MMNPALDKLIQLLAKSFAEQWVQENKKKKEKKDVEGMSVRSVQHGQTK